MTATPSVIPAREKFIRRQIEHAWEIAAYYHALPDPDSAAVFEEWAWRAEAELRAERKLSRGGRA
jgi:hypothetical protein